MPLISRIGRKDPKVRLLHASMYVVLILGSLTMVYPFLLMLSGSTKSGVDIRDLDVVPRFLHDDDTLYRKYVEGLFNERLNLLKAAYDTDAATFERVAPPPHLRSGLVREWLAFTQSPDIPHYAFGVGFLETPSSRTQSELLRSFKRELVKEYGGSIDAMNRGVETEFFDWNAFFMLSEDYILRRNRPGVLPFDLRFRQFKTAVPPLYRYYFTLGGFYTRVYLKAQYTRDIAAYNQEHGTAHASYDDISLSPTLPEGGDLERQDWETFVRYTLNLLWVRVDPAARPGYQGFLEAKYGDIEALNRNYGADYRGFDEIALIEEPPFSGIRLSDWDNFIKGWKDPDTGRRYAPEVGALRVHGLDFMFQDYLQAKYGDIEPFNAACGEAVASFAEVRPPQPEAHYQAFLEARRPLRIEFATRNYVAVIDYMVLHGRGVFNTVIYCLLAVLSALIINPLAAYAMSRYRMPTTYKILLFMLLTMAFPPMVTQIPVFLMLRDFNLLNTFAALVLPGLAHGYSIFLLKGFFDSLPRELYESASIDGAGEWTMFWQVTMSLSKPILAVIALQAFNMAYANFMFALLICQDTSMWTLMVWLYQLQQTSGQAVLYASLIVAAIPTLVIFLFCQNIIMRGIVVPVEK